MKNTIIYPYCLFFVLLLLLSTCIKEESLVTVENKRFFDSTGAVDHIQTIASSLRIKNDSSNFVPQFIKAYGYPLWQDALSFEVSNKIVYAIPIKSTDSNIEIESIWFFSLDSEKIDYRILTRQITNESIDDWVEKNWIFDYFTYKVLHKEPSSGLKFYSNAIERTRTVVVIEEKTCVHAFVEVGGVVTDKGWHCWTTSYEIFIADLKSEDGSSSGGNGTIYHGASGGGKIPIFGDDLIAVAPNASKLLQNHNMIQENWQTLEKMVEKIKEKCIGESLYNTLVEILKDSKINVEIVSDGSAYDASSNTLKIDLSMESNQLFHELWHALQALSLGLDVFSKSTLNQEVEAHYAQYLYLKTLSEYKGSKWEKMYKKDPRLNAIERLEDYIDKKGRLKPGVSRQLFDYEFTCVVCALQENGYGDESVFKYDDSKKDLENFMLLRELTKEC